MNKKFLLSLLILGLFVSVPLFNVQAQGEAVPVLINAEGGLDVEVIATGVEVGGEEDGIELDETVTAEELGVETPSMLPSSPFYFFKSAGRGVKSFFTFNNVKKAELKLQYANERLLEAQEMAENVDGEGDAKRVAKTVDKYEKEIEKIQTRLIKFEGLSEEQKEKFIEKFADNQVKQQKILDGIESKLTEKGVSEETVERILKKKESAMEKFANGALSAVDAEVLQEKIAKAMEEGKGSHFKHFKNLTILESLEDSVPEEARKAIEKAQERIKNKLEEALGDKEKGIDDFTKIIKRSGGNSLHHLKILDELELDELTDEQRIALDEAREVYLDKINGRLDNFKTDQSKKNFFNRLKEGDFDDLRILDVLENGLPESKIEHLRGAKEGALENLKNKLEDADTDEEKEVIFESLKKFKDVRQFRVLEEARDAMPEDKKELFEKMRLRLEEGVNEDIDKASVIERQKIIKRFSSDVPEDLETIGRIKINPIIKWQVSQEQATRLQNKIESIEDEDKIERFKAKLEKPEVKNELKWRKPEIFKKADERSVKVRALRKLDDDTDDDDEIEAE